MSYIDEPTLPDPVIEEYKKHVDVSLLRENLKLTPEQRLLKMIEFIEFLEEMRSAAKRGRAKTEGEET